jgi:hypothetical protein
MLDYVWAQWLTHASTAPESDLYRPNTPAMPEPGYVTIQAGMARFYRPELLEQAYAGSLYWLDALVRRAAALEQQGTRTAISVAPPDFAVSPEWLPKVLAQEQLGEQDLRFDLPEAVVAAVAARHGFTGPLVMVHECLRAAEKRGEDTYYTTNTHWSARGNEIVAHVLAARLAEAWDLGAGRVAAGDTPDCRSEPPAPDPEIARRVGALLDQIDAAAEQRDRIVAAVHDGERFASSEAVAALLARAGLRPSTGYIDGGVDFASRGFGRAVVRLHGRARDVAAPEARLLLLVFRKGELAGVGYAPPSEDGRFELEVIDETPSGIYGAGMRLVAVTPGGEWSELPVAVGPLHQRMLH